QGGSGILPWERRRARDAASTNGAQALHLPAPRDYAVCQKAAGRRELPRHFRQQRRHQRNYVCPSCPPSGFDVCGHYSLALVKRWEERAALLPIDHGNCTAIFCLIAWISWPLSTSGGNASCP